MVKAERIILVRHGESMGNVDEGTYVVVPDWKVPLTKKGHQDGHIAGLRIKELVGEKPLYIYCSPYMRTKQTLARIVECLEGNTIVGVREEPRLTEQAFGNFQNVEGVRYSKAERARFGRFYYRFPDGESGLDVYSRVTSFLSTLYGDFTHRAIKDKDLNVVVVTHGLTLRLLIMRWFQYSISDFEESLNPPNGGLVVINRLTDEKGNQWYEMDDASCELIGFQKRHTKGSLWRLLRDIHEDVEGEGEEDEDGGDGPGEGGMSREGGGRMPASVEKERRERARERERLEREEEG